MMPWMPLAGGLLPLDAKTEETKYGVMLVGYRGDSSSAWQQFNMWIYIGGQRFETLDAEEAKKVRDEYTAKNPNGLYDVKIIEESE